MSTILIIILLILIFGGGGGYYAHGRVWDRGARRRAGGCFDRPKPAEPEPKRRQAFK